MNVFYGLIALMAAIWLTKPTPSPNIYDVNDPNNYNVNNIEFWEQLEEDANKQNAAQKQKYNFNLEAPQPLPPIVVGVRS